ncbi:MAG: L-aspartate oxidase [Chloroflexota bacterium]
MKEKIETDILIIGVGIAGGTAALKLADQGQHVTVITRANKPKKSNTYWAQGGIIYTSPEDRPDLFMQDILHAGAGHTYPKAARILAKEGPALLKEILIDRIKVPFDLNKEGKLDVVMEAAHSVPRIIHATDATGRAIEIAMLNVIKDHPNITLLTGHTAVDLLTSSHHSEDNLSLYEPPRCAGAYVFDRKNKKVKRILARKTILATGGLGNIFLRTTNPKGARGDGIAMAYRAGARVINTEYIQFHPTTFHHEMASNFLISEAVRGVGARLVHEDGQPFMQKYDPQWKDLAPRDVVARSIRQEMIERDIPNVYLDLHSYVDEAEIKSHFPNIAQRCQEYGVDITKALIPVVPGAHYSCGGVWVDEWGKTSLAQLYAIGEVACTGVHGANRLASTSLLEGLVWGARAAQDVVSSLAKAPAINDTIPSWQDTGQFEPDPLLIGQDMSTIQNVMWNYVGLVRTEYRLQRAMRELRHLETEIERFYRISQMTDGLIGLRNAVRTAVIVTQAAIANKQSMGCHFRE